MQSMETCTSSSSTTCFLVPLVSLGQWTLNTNGSPFENPGLLAGFGLIIHYFSASVLHGLFVFFGIPPIDFLNIKNFKYVDHI